MALKKSRASRSLPSARGSESMEKRDVSQIIAESLRVGSYVIEPYAKTICANYGIPVPRFKVAKNRKEAVKSADELGYPVVLKIISPDIIHKNDAGGVVLNINAPKEVRKAYREILANVKEHAPDAGVLGILVEEMVPPSTEVVVGGIRDPQFGPTLMFGLGGIFVEILRDVAFRICPITRQDGLEMISEVKGYQILKGYRGQPAVDINKIVEILLGTSKLIMDYPEIKEIDLNPVIVYEKEAKVVDSKIILQKPGKTET
jgi:acyl-CoA synthetase (NDP forming)